MAQLSSIIFKCPPSTYPPLGTPHRTQCLLRQDVGPAKPQKLAENLILIIMPACATTTTFLDNKNSTFNILLSRRFPQIKNSVFGRFSSLPPMSPPLRNAKFYFYCRLAVSENVENFWNNFGGSFCALGSFSRHTGTLVGKFFKITDPPPPIPKSEEFEVGNGKDYRCQHKFKVKLIPRKYFVAFAFVLIYLGRMIFPSNVYMDTSPRILLSLS